MLRYGSQGIVFLRHGQTKRCSKSLIICSWLKLLPRQAISMSYRRLQGLHLIQMAYSTTNTFQCCFLRLKVCLIPCVFSGIVGDEASLFLAELDDHYKAGRLTFNSDWFVCLALSDWQTPVRPSPKHPAGSSRRVKATLVWNN